MAVYLVTGPGDTQRLVDARLQSQAINHVAKDILKVKVVTTKEAMALAKDGVELEEAGAAD